jgi:competence protein ComFB
LYLLRENLMALHNIMEDVVSQYLNDILKEKNDICNCEQCMEDMKCYALNKVKPMYVVSSRGVIHTENKKRLNYQDEIDVYSIVVEAVSIVSKTKRHDEKINLDGIVRSCEEEETKYTSKSGCFFNFPQIVGRILDSETLNAIDDVEVSLNYQEFDAPLKMFNNKWKNPLKMVSQMEGVFTFWPAPEPSEKNGIQKEYQLNLKISKPGYETIRRFIQLRIISVNELNSFVKTENIYYLDDIYLYPEGLGEEEGNA